MRPDLEQYYLIDQYLENKLTGEELAAFENQLIQDTVFANEVQEHRMLNNLILEAELKDVRSQIEKDLLDIQKPSFFRMHWQWIAIGVFGLLGIIYLANPDKKESKVVIQNSATTSIDNNKQIEPEKAIIQSSKNAVVSPSTSKGNTFKKSTVSTPTRIDSAQTVKTIEHITATTVLTKTQTEAAVIETKPSEVVKKIDCSSSKIQCSISTETSCINTQTGSIHIDKISGGEAPYSYTLNNKKIKERNLNELQAGIYEVKISDKNGCFTEFKATILEKNCAPSIQQGTKFNINPSIGEVCLIPFDTDKKGSVSIYNRSGKVVYRDSNPNSESIEWKGTDGYGGLAEAGLYIYMIDYSDGIKVTGEINIIR